MPRQGELVAMLPSGARFSKGHSCDAAAGGASFAAGYGIARNQFAGRKLDQRFRSSTENMQAKERAMTLLKHLLLGAPLTYAG